MDDSEVLIPVKLNGPMVVPATIRKGRLKVRRDRCGVHVFDRTTGLNVLFDEVTVPEREWAQAPRHLAIALTNACDLRCPYCYAPKHRAVLKRERVLAWLREADAAGCLGVGFGGGEPTTVRWFAQLCRTVTRETALAVSFTTHGHRLSEELLDELAGSVHMIRISIDGVGATYERLRGRPFDALCDRLHAVREVLSFGINVVVNDDTIGELDAIAQLALSTGASELLLLPEQRAGGGAGASCGVMSWLRAWIDQHGVDIRLAVSEQGAEGIPVAEPFGDQPSIERYAHIDADGVLRPSSFASRGIPIADQNFVTAYRQLRQEDLR